MNITLTFGHLGVEHLKTSRAITKDLHVLQKPYRCSKTTEMNNNDFFFNHNNSLTMHTTVMLGKNIPVGSSEIAALASVAVFLLFPLLTR